MLKEDQLIESLKAYSGGLIGDDGAVVSFPPSQRCVVSKDLLIEGCHFRSSYFSPEDLAHKALHVNLSDMAAMGASPLYVLCGIAIPESLQTYAVSFLHALGEACLKENLVLIGGDTTNSPSSLMISLTLIGQACATTLKYRHTAQVGDVVAVVGEVGLARLGFLHLERGESAPAVALQHFLRPQAKIHEGQWLAQCPAVTGMMDISDGLYIDLQKLAKASQKKITIHLDRLKAVLHPAVSLSTALEGGEDYGLLITCRPEQYQELSKTFSQRFETAFFPIGFVAEGEGILWKEQGEDVSFSLSPFYHF